MNRYHYEQVSQQSRNEVLRSFIHSRNLFKIGAVSLLDPPLYNKQNIKVIRVLVDNKKRKKTNSPCYECLVSLACRAPHQTDCDYRAINPTPRLVKK